MSDGRPKGSPSTRLEMQPPYGLAVAISDRQDGSFEQQEVSGRDVVASAKIIAVQRKRWIRRRWAGQEMDHQSLTAGGSGRELRKRIGNGGVEGSGRIPNSIGISRLSGLQEVASPTAARRRRQAFARPLVGPPNTLPVLSAPGWILMSLLNLAHSSQQYTGQVAV